MKQVFGLRRAARPDEPGPHPARVHPGVHRGRGRGGPAGPDPATPIAAFANRDILLIEGTGHAGVGAVIGLSNAAVAAMLGAPAVIVSEGGVGRPIDEIVLNASLFARHGVKVAGAIVNKVDLDAKPGLARTLERGLAPPRDPAARRAARTGRSCRTRPWRWSSRASTARRIHPGPGPRRGHRRDRDRGDGAAATCSSGSVRAASSSCRATGATSSARSSARERPAPTTASARSASS